MKLQVTKKLENSLYSSKFELIEIDEFDRELLLDREGTLELNIGGNIVKTVTTKDELGADVITETVLFTQGDKYIKFASAMPFERAWSIAQFGEPKAGEIAEAYTEMIAERIKTIVETMRTTGDTFSGVDEIIL